jgi:hypothetical protein
MRMPPPIAKKMLVLALIPVAAAVTLAMWPSSSGPRVSVAFVGWVDNDPGTTYARFAITNNSTRSIKPGSFIVETPPAHYESPSYRRPSDGFIRPGQVEIVTVLAPLEEGPWKLHLSFSKAGLRHIAANCYAELFYHTRIYAATPDAIRFDADYEVQSDWVTQQPSAQPGGCTGRRESASVDMFGPLARRE